MVFIGDSGQWLMVVMMIRGRYKHVSRAVPDLKTQVVQVDRKHKHFKSWIMIQDKLDTGHGPRNSEEDAVAWGKASQEAEEFDMGLKEWTQIPVRGWKNHSRWMEGVTRQVFVESTKTVGKEWAINWKCGLRPDSGRKLRRLDFILVVMKR